MLFDDGPIIACSSGSSANVAISVIRLSGFKDLSCFSSFFAMNLSEVVPRKAYFSKLFNFEKKLLDEVVFTYFAAPHSYNGENILEISAHGNKINIKNIIQAFLMSGQVRASRPGEFTYRALQNGKLNFSQVEGLDLLLNASSNFALDQGMNLLNGELFTKFTELYQSFLRLEASLELGIDFSDDIGEEQFWNGLKEHFIAFLKILRPLYERSLSRSKDLLHPKIVLYGPTNVGKSSLFNLLVSEERAIVSETPGTTRDYLREVLLLGELEFSLADTAGIRLTENKIEKEGIERSKKLLGHSFFKILVLDAREDYESYLDGHKDDFFDLVLFTHSDTFAQEKIGEIGGKYLDLINSDNFYYCSLIDTAGPMGAMVKGSGSIGPARKGAGSIGPAKKGAGSIGPAKKETGPIGPVKKGAGPIEPEKILDIRVLIGELVTYKHDQLTKKSPLILARHINCVGEIYHKSLKFQEIMGEVRDLGILSSELSILKGSVISLVGVITPDDVLASLFDNFCIGK